MIATQTQTANPMAYPRDVLRREPLFRFTGQKSTNYMKHNAFTLLETMIAISIIMIATAGSLNLINQAINSLGAPEDEIVAANLSAEGIEVIRNIRDSNWLEDVAWDSGLTFGAGCSATAASSLGVSSCIPTSTCPDSLNVNYNSVSASNLPDDRLYFASATGLYSHNTALALTRFSRRVELTYCKDWESRVYMRLRSTVDRTDKFGLKQFTLLDHLYDWQP